MERTESLLWASTENILSCFFPVVPSHRRAWHSPPAGSGLGIVPQRVVVRWPRHPTEWKQKRGRESDCLPVAV